MQVKGEFVRLTCKINGTFSLGWMSSVRLQQVFMNNLFHLQLRKDAHFKILHLQKVGRG